MEITTAGFIRIRIKNFLGYSVAVGKANNSTLRDIKGSSSHT